ncbi:MAG: hypothetical protein M3Q64_01255, partial [bacterium]|nr:hypothetical protein [bacterium]
KKYDWMGNGQYAEIIPKLIKEDAQLKWVEQKSTNSIVSQIIRAAEAKKPKLRYGAPLYQKIVVQLLRVVGI